ncbi:MAG: hypothetical protein ACXVIN_07600 [Halobacteriota archaeon]
MPSVMPQCWGCRHYIGAHNCYAYPNGIPQAIWFNEHDHRIAYTDDGGIRFDEMKR